MSDHSPVKSDMDKEVAVYSPGHGHEHDIERGETDTGIKFQAAPLARELKGRHMQMIALGTLLSINKIRGTVLIITFV